MFGLLNGGTFESLSNVCHWISEIQLMALFRFSNSSSNLEVAFLDIPSSVLSSCNIACLDSSSTPVFVLINELAENKTSCSFIF
jgi:hypothetical protein